jgi:transposase-like protein
MFRTVAPYDRHLRRVCRTARASADCHTGPNAIWVLNARYRRPGARGHFPTEQAALKCLYLVTRSLDLTGTGRNTMGDAVEARHQRLRHLGDRFPAAETC